MQKDLRNMNIIKIIILLLSVSCLSCVNVSEPMRVNGSSAKTTESSIKRMNRSFGVRGIGKQFLLFKALLQIQMSEYSSIDEAKAAGANMKEVDFEYLAAKIDGLTYIEIIALGDESPTKVTISAKKKK